MRVRLVQARDVGKSLAPRREETFLDLLANLFQRFNAVRRKRRRNEGNPPLPRLRKARDLLDRVGLQPFLRAKARLKRGDERFLCPTQVLAQQARGFLTLTMIRVPLPEIAQRHAVIAHHQPIGLPVQRGKAFAHRSRQRTDIGGVVKIRPHRAHRGLPWHLHEGAEELVIGGGGGGPRVMGIQRKEQKALTASLYHFLRGGDGRRVAIAHAEIHH